MKFDISKSPYGPKDEIGRLNEITPESRKRALSGIDPTRVFDLSVDYFLKPRQVHHEHEINREGVSFDPAGSNGRVWNRGGTRDQSGGGSR